MTAPEPTPLEVRYVEAQPDSGPHKPAMAAHFVVSRGLRRQHLPAADFATALLAGDWMERVLAETSPCVWSIREEKHPYGESCLRDHPDRHPGVGFCWVRPRKQAAAIRAYATGDVS